MGLLQKLKSALGLDGARTADAGTGSPRDVDVTVEREPSSESEDAVKGTDTGTVGSETDAERAGAGVGTDEPTGDESAADERSADEPSVDADETTDESTDDGSEVADETGAIDEAETTDEATETADEPSAETGAPVTEINGIGPAYGQRLSDAGVESVADLADADADELADETDVSASRIEGWIDAAAEY